MASPQAQRAVCEGGGVSISPEWDSVYASGRERIEWPWTDLISLTRRYLPDLNGKRVLELGCGSGGNIPFFSNAEYRSIEGSRFVLNELLGKNPDLWDRVVLGDFTESIPFQPGFDLVFDRASVAHNDTQAIKRALALSLDIMKPGGFYIGIDWFSTTHDEFTSGDWIDIATRNNYRKEQFAGVGCVHFEDAEGMRSLFAAFDILYLAEKVVTNVVNGFAKAATWNVVARKPG